MSGGQAVVLPDGVQAVLLDGLGTLVALQPPWPALVLGLREAHGLDVAPEEAERAFRTEMAYYRAHHHEGRDARTLADLRARCAQVLGRELPATVRRTLSNAQLTAAMLGALRFEAYSDAPAALAGLRARGCKLVAVSNWDISLSTVLDALGISPMLDGAVTSASVGVPKPAPAIFEAALALAGVPPQRALHVGDSLAHDVLGARAAGLAAALLSRTCADGEAAREEDAAREEEDAARKAGVRVIMSLAELLT
jgi:putative hydrolase of the HAD superfamily